MPYLKKKKYIQGVQKKRGYGNCNCFVSYSIIFEARTKHLIGLVKFSVSAQLYTNFSGRYDGAEKLTVELSQHSRD